MRRHIKWTNMQWVWHQYLDFTHEGIAGNVLLMAEICLQLVLGNLYIEPRWCSPLAAWTALLQIILLSLSIDFGNGPSNRELSPGSSPIDSHNNELILRHVLNCVSLCSQMPFYPLPKTEWFTDPLLFSSCLWILSFPNKNKVHLGFLPWQR